MNEIRIFENVEFGQVRTMIIDGEPWFVGKDVAEALKYSNTRDALSRHVDEEDKGVAKCDTLGGTQSMTVVNESGVYALILGSHLPSAKKFKRWVTSEVLPSIRKYGSYSPQNYAEALRALADEVEAKEKLAIENREMKPKAEYFDDLVERNLLTSIRDTAKEIKIKERAFVKWLEEKSFIYRDAKKKIKPYAEYITGNKKYFEIKEWKNDSTQGNQTMITPRGREAFRLLLYGEDK